MYTIASDYYIDYNVIFRSRTVVVKELNGINRHLVIFCRNYCLSIMSNSTCYVYYLGPGFKNNELDKEILYFEQQTGSIFDKFLTANNGIIQSSSEKKCQEALSKYLKLKAFI